MNKADIKQKARELAARMTLDEKLAQMAMGDCEELFENGVLNEERAKAAFGTAGIGALQVPHLPAAETADHINQIHAFFKKTMRIPVPPFLIAEALHGVMIPGATIFPQSISMGSTWNDELMGRVSSAIAEEASAAGVTQALCPDLDLCREPRWGRLEETFGEDACVNSRMGIAYVSNLQGGDEVDGHHVAATLKHFAAHGTPEGGINLAPVQTGERLIQEYYLAPFRNVIRETNPVSVMPAYSELDGVPCTSSRRLLTEILRDELGFDGYTISDFGAMDMLLYFHHTASTPGEAGKQSLHAGMDLEAPERSTFGEEFEQMVKRGEVSMDELNQAVERILAAKLRAGIFEKTYFDPENAERVFQCDAHKALAYEAATESVILLENKENALPLRAGLRSIAVVGPNADAWQLGDYTLDRPCKTPLQAIRERAGADVEVRYAAGCDIHSTDASGIAQAAQAVRGADVAILCVGGCSTKSYGIGWGRDEDQVKTCGEGFDVCDLGLPGRQQQLAEAVIGTGVPTIVVHIDGRPASIPWIKEHCAALVEMWYGGQEGADALAAILFGDVNPSGRLTVSVPESVGQSPAYYNHKPSGRGYYHKPGSPEKPGRDYVFASPAPLYPFGYGLSYTSFGYSGLSAEFSAEKDAFEVEVCVKNTGKVTGKEVVQVYFHDEMACVTRPVRELKEFAKVELAPGEERRLAFSVPKRELAYMDEHYRWVTEPGMFEVFVGDQRVEVELPAET